MSRLSDYLGRGIVPVSQTTILETTAFTFDEDVFALVVLIGAGGSGGCVLNGPAGTTGNGRAHAQGGNAGGTVMQLVRFVAGETYTFTIPDVTPGVGTTTNVTARTTYQGQDGGDTTLTSTLAGWSTITAYGGLGGVAWAQASSSGTDSTDHAHRTQTWGANADLIFPGGYGGAITVSVTQNTNEERGIATGGGAVNLAGLPQASLNGGDAELSNASGSPAIATGGGGINGHGGNAEYSGTGSQVGTVTGGGSTTGSGEDLDNSTASNVAGAGAEAVPYSPAVLFPLNGGSESGLLYTGSGAVDGGPGAGGAAVITPSAYGSSTDDHAGDGGVFAGGGGITDVRSAGTQSKPYGGAGKWGGGGGGACNSPWGTVSAQQQGYSGDGGQGVAFIFMLSDFGRVLAS